MTSQEEIEDRDPFVRKIRRAQEAFQARWPYVFELDHSAIHEADFEVYWAYYADGVVVLDGLEDWLLENCGAPDHDWEQHRALIGIRDPDAAFWFKMRWM